MRLPLLTYLKAGHAQTNTLTFSHDIQVPQLAGLFTVTHPRRLSLEEERKPPFPHCIHIIDGCCPPVTATVKM